MSRETLSSTDRFSQRVDSYRSSRPSYPKEAFELICEELGVVAGSVVADIGCGTGISAAPFVERGCMVFGVEPNPAMRAAAADHFSGASNFTAVDGTAEATTLADQSVDLVVAAQAFHWFDEAKTRMELQRILSFGGSVALLWNQRNEEGPFGQAYERFLLDYGTDYLAVKETYNVRGRLDDFFDELRSYAFSNGQLLDQEGLATRVVSSSYMPNADDPGYESMTDALAVLFDEHNFDGLVNMEYTTEVYLGSWR